MKTLVILIIFMLSTLNSNDISIVSPLNIVEKRIFYEEILDIRGNELGSKQNPVKCFMPQGAKDYLDRLRDSKGEPVHYKWIGGVFAPTEDMLIIHKYLIVSNDRSIYIYMDRKHPLYIENKPIQSFFVSFTIVPATLFEDTDMDNKSIK